MRSKRSCTKAIGSWSCARDRSLGRTIPSASVSKNSGRSFMPDQHSSYKAVFHRHDVQLAGIIVVMAVIFSALSKSFLSASNLVSLLENYSVMATVLVRIGGNWLVAFGLSAGFGILLGVVNALLIYYLRALAVIVTISMM